MPTPSIIHLWCMPMPPRHVCLRACDCARLVIHPRIYESTALLLQGRCPCVPPASFWYYYNAPPWLHSLSLASTALCRRTLATTDVHVEHPAPPRWPPGPGHAHCDCILRRVRRYSLSSRSKVISIISAYCLPHNAKQAPASSRSGGRCLACPCAPAVTQKTQECKDACMHGFQPGPTDMCTGSDQPFDRTQPLDRTAFAPQPAVEQAGSKVQCTRQAHTRTDSSDAVPLETIRRPLLRRLALPCGALQLHVDVQPEAHHSTSQHTLWR